MMRDPSSPEFDVFVKSLLLKMGGKGFLKAPSASCSSLVGYFDDNKTFHETIEMHNHHGNEYNHYLVEYMDKYCENLEYPLSGKRRGAHL